MQKQMHSSLTAAIGQLDHFHNRAAHNSSLAGLIRRRNSFNQGLTIGKLSGQIEDAELEVAVDESNEVPR